MSHEVVVVVVQILLAFEVVVLSHWLPSQACPAKNMLQNEVIQCPFLCLAAKHFLYKCTHFLPPMQNKRLLLFCILTGNHFTCILPVNYNT